MATLLRLSRSPRLDPDPTPREEELMTVHLLEATCPLCQETFNPDGPEDLEHLETMDGRRCGGQAISYEELHTDGRVVQVYTTYRGLQVALLIRAVALPERKLPPVKFYPHRLS
jgi:hypothetical protein